MKVLQVIDTLGRGGAEQALVTLLPELRRQGVEGAVLVRSGPMDLAVPLRAAGIAVIRLAPRHRWNLIGMAREIAALARREGADLLHAHLYFPAVATALLRVLRLAPVRSCVTFHNLAYAGANRPGPGLRARRKLAQVLYPRGIDRFLAVSAAVAGHTRQALGLARVDVLPNPVDVTALRRLLPADPPVPVRGSAVRIVLPGRIVAEKGHEDLIAALARLRDRGLCPGLTIAGDGPLRGRVAAQVRALGLDDQVRFTGALEHAALLRIVAAADIVAVPSRHEGFGLTALEAMALGRAVVASAAGGLPETLGPAGIVVPLADPDALAAALALLADDPDLRARLGALGAARAAAAFDLPAVAARLKQVYAEILGPPANPPGKR